MTLMFVLNSFHSKGIIDKTNHIDVSGPFSLTKKRKC